MKYKCPHCGKEINPASMMGKQGAKNRDTSSERMREVAKARWNKVAEEEKN